MKIIKTALFESLSPDPGLGYGVAERDVSDAAGTGEDTDRYGEQGFLEVHVDWDDLMESHISNGYEVTLEMDAIDGIVFLDLYYTYDYIQSNPEKIKVTKATINLGKTKGDAKIGVNDEDLLYHLKEDFERDIIEDIGSDSVDFELRNRF